MTHYICTKKEMNLIRSQKDREALVAYAQGLCTPVMDYTPSDSQLLKLCK